MISNIKTSSVNINSTLLILLAEREKECGLQALLTQLKISCSY